MEKVKTKGLRRIYFYKNFTDFGLRVGICGDNNLISQSIIYVQIGFWSLEILLSKTK